MKRKVVLLIVLAVLLIPSIQVEAVTGTAQFTWQGRTTQVTVTVEFESQYLTDGIHYFDITVELIALSTDANDIHDIEVFYKIPGLYESTVVNFDPILTIGNSQTLSKYIVYEEAWEMVSLHVYLECKENIPLSQDNHLLGDYKPTLWLYPKSDEPTDTTDTTDTTGFEVVGVLAAGVFVTFLVMRKR